MNLSPLIGNKKQKITLADLRRINGKRNNTLLKIRQMIEELKEIEKNLKFYSEYELYWIKSARKDLENTLKLWRKHFVKDNYEVK